MFFYMIFDGLEVELDFDYESFSRNKKPHLIGVVSIGILYSLGATFEQDINYCNFQYLLLAN